MFPQFLHKSSHDIDGPRTSSKSWTTWVTSLPPSYVASAVPALPFAAAAKAMGCGVERVLLGTLEMQNPRCCCCWWWWWRRLFVGFLLTFCWLVVDLLLIYWMLWASVVKQNPELKSGQLFKKKSGNPLFTTTLARKRGRWFGFS